MDIYENWLAQLPGIGNRKKIKLVTKFQSAKEVFFAKEHVLANFEDNKKKVLTDKNLQSLLERERKMQAQGKALELEKRGMKVVTFGNPKYPTRLSHIFDPPYQLFYYGALPETYKSSIAIIGARECTAYGENMARRIGNALGKYDVNVISGMAKGIDGIGQLACIQAGGRSYGILGSGVDICYPKENLELYEILKKNGGVLSEYLPKTLPRPCLFPPRNRIISGLSDGVIVVEARRKSGTQITVDIALEQGKEIYVVPGRMTDGLSEGCNQLIKEGAEMLVSVEGFLKEHFKEVKEYDVKQKEKDVFPLNEKEREVYRCIDYYPKSLNELTRELNGLQNMAEIMNQLISLEIKKYIIRVASNSYILRENASYE